MRWLIFTNGALDSAASRLRAFYPLLFSSFADRHTVLINPPEFSVEEIDVLYIQKCFIPTVGEIARHCRAAGKKIIFDLDDPPEIVTEYDNSKTLATYLSAADHITTDTPERAKHFQEIYNLPRPLEIIPDCIDISDESQMAREWSQPAAHRGRVSAVWFGNADNFHSIQDAFIELSRMDGLDLYVVSSGALGQWIEQNKLPYHFIPWSLDFWERYRGAFDICLLSHFGSDISMSKGENKMVTALANGVLPIVSRTPAYERLADRIKLSDHVFDTTRELVEIVRKKMIDPSRVSLGDIREVLLGLYSRERIASQLEALVS
jgi:hypothetical protein